MMGKTHLAVGVAAALLACHPSTPAGLLAATAGGAIGGMVCDIECRASLHARDRQVAWGLAAVVLAFALCADRLLQAGLLTDLLQRQAGQAIVAGLGILALLMLGRRSGHRAFSHSLCYVLPLTACVWLILPPLALPFLAAALSHLLLDLLNHRPIHPLWPLSRKGFCLKLCRADGWVNRVMMGAGAVAAVGYFVAVSL
ncbi:MAG: metal-dependent hydrolase [Clostridia bacterium]|nr:metal-dependent hydrolase [Clostridia bacterium]